MKNRFKLIFLSAATLVASAPTASRAQSAVPAEKVGVYDSRLVAYARFWRPEYQAKLQERMAQARAAKAAGDEAKMMRAEQSRLHLEVFSTAPLDNDEDRAWLAGRLPEVAREAGVARVVSKWDAAALQGVPAAQRVDVTDRLVKDCGLDEKQTRMMAEIGKATPLPLAEARKMDAEGKL